MCPTETSHQTVNADLVVELGDAHSAISVAPHAGGRLMRWTLAGHEIIGWPANADLSKAAKVRGGNPLLFPFIGRHRVGDTANVWQDGTGTMHPLPQHGFARDLPFSFAVSDDRRAITMTLASGAATRSGYPFDFTFSATYRLEGESLQVTLETHNTGNVPLPYYAGHHFYFALPHELRGESRLQLPPTLLCHQLADGSISAPQPEADGYTPGDSRIQDCFHLLPQAGMTEDGAKPSVQADQAPRAKEQGERDGTLIVTLDTPSLQRRLTLELAMQDAPGNAPWYALTTWTESGESDFYCVEPWLGLPNAIHHGQGLRWIAPGGRERADCRITGTFGERS